MGIFIAIASLLGGISTMVYFASSRPCNESTLLGLLAIVFFMFIGVLNGYLIDKGKRK